MAPLVVELLWSAGAALLTAALALAGRVATVGGVLTLAILVGTITGFGGWPWGVVALTLIACLVIAGRYRRADKAALAETIGRAQTLTWLDATARLGWAALLAIAFQRHSSPLGFAAFVGAIAASAADVVATQLGLLSAQRPRLITTWRPTMAGTPGAISALGMLAAVGASWLVGLTGLATQSLAAWLQDAPAPQAWAWLPVVALAGGMAGALLDSLLAATAQRVYYDPRRQEPSEYEADADGLPNEPVRGWAWLTGQAIDLVATAAGAACTGALVTWLAHSFGHW
ncbi:MAG: DUF92 domain-containing protein [Anaerolineae bacterium]|jgi:uncharacterized protein (TIGR00297 family)